MFMRPVVQKRHKGFTLQEVLVAAAVVVIMMGIAIPATRQIMKSFRSEKGLRSVINAALTSARARAASEGKYAGVRFQQDKKGRQYIIFIIENSDPTYIPSDDVALSNAFKAVDGVNPVKLPASVGVMSFKVRSDHANIDPDPANPEIDIDDVLLDNTIAANMLDGKNINYTDATTFSVVFNPQGSLAIKDVLIWSRQHLPTTETELIKDSVFNNEDNVYGDDPENPAMFLMDAYPALGLGQEKSRQQFVIFNKEDYDKAPAGSKYSDYIENLEPLYVSPYTGRIINTKTQN